MRSVNEIKPLLDKFYDGTTSTREEHDLKEFFTTAINVPEELRADMCVFQALADIDNEMNADIDIPKGLVDELALTIDRLAETETTILTREWWTWQRLTGIAASVCILISLCLSLISNDQESIPSIEPVGLRHAYIPQTEEEAIIKTSRALMLVAEKLNTANSRVEYASHKLEEINVN